MGRLKTGTPARIKMSSLDLGVMEEQPGDSPTPFMSSLKKTPSPNTTVLLHNQDNTGNQENY